MGRCFYAGFAIAITGALVFIGVFVERQSGTQTESHRLYLGLACDTTGATCMSLLRKTALESGDRARNYPYDHYGMGNHRVFRKNPPPCSISSSQYWSLACMACAHLRHAHGNTGPLPWTQTSRLNGNRHSPCHWLHCIGKPRART